MQIRPPMQASCKPPSFPVSIGNYSSERDRELRKQRTATMNTSRDPTKGTRIRKTLKLIHKQGHLIAAPL